MCLMTCGTCEMPALLCCRAAFVCMDDLFCGWLFKKFVPKSAAQEKHLRSWMCLTPKHGHLQFRFCVAVNTSPCREYQSWVYAGGGRDTILDFRENCRARPWPVPYYRVASAWLGLLRFGRGMVRIVLHFWFGRFLFKKGHSRSEFQCSFRGHLLFRFCLHFPKLFWWLWFRLLEQQFQYLFLVPVRFLIHPAVKRRPMERFLNLCFCCRCVVH